MEAPEAIRDPDAWRGLVVLASANNWDGNAMADQHMARALTEHAPVLFVDPPISHLSPRHYPELRRVDHRANLSPPPSRRVSILVTRGDGSSSAG